MLIRIDLAQIQIAFDLGARHIQQFLAIPEYFSYLNLLRTHELRYIINLRRIRSIFPFGIESIGMTATFDLAIQFVHHFASVLLQIRVVHLSLHTARTLGYQIPVYLNTPLILSFTAFAFLPEVPRVLIRLDVFRPLE